MDKLLTTYLAGFIEASPGTALNWRDVAYKELYSSTKLLVYDPMRQEESKTGKEACNHVQYCVGLKKSGNYKLFDKEFDKIWLGEIKRTHDLPRLFKLLQDRALIDGNKEHEMKLWGDYEAVCRADFIIAYMKKDIQTVGTIGEIFIAMMLNIPVYLIIDTPKTETNSTLLYWVRYSGGEIFYKIEDTLKYVKEKYKL